MALQFDASQYFTKTQIRALLPAPPLAPTVSVLDVSETYIDLQILPPATPSWALYASRYIVGYTIVYATGGSVGSQYVTKVGTAYRIDGLIAGLTYLIQVSATDFEAREGAFSAGLSVSTTASTTPPIKPVFTVTPLTIGARIDVTTWNTEPDFVGYDLYRDTDALLMTNLSLAVAASFKGVSFTDTAYGTGGGYWYYLKAKNYSGLSTNSDVVGPVTIVPQPGLVAAEISMATATAVANADGSITFTFPVSSDANHPYYHIWRQWLGGLSGWVLIGTLTPGSSHIYTDSTTINDFTYQYSASVVNDYGESGFDTTHIVQATAQDTQVPAAILGNISYSGSVGGILVAWDSSKDPRTAYYIVRWRYYQVGKYSEFNTGEAIRTNSYLIEGLEDPVTTYPPTRDALANEFEVEIAAVSIDNVPSSFVARRDIDDNRVPVEFPELNNYQPAGNTVPPAPVMSSPIINADNSITLNWTALGISTQAGFLIEKLSSLSAVWENLLIIRDSSSGSKRFTATGLEPFKFRGTTYTFRISTVDNSGNLSASVSTSVLHAVDTSGPVSYAAGFSVTPNMGYFTLAWTNAVTTDYFNCIYEIWRRETASTEPGFTPDSVLVKVVEVAGTSDGKPNGWTDSSPDIDNKVTAIFAIRARDRYGNAQVVNPSDPTTFLGHSASQTSLDVNDKNVATTVAMGPLFPTTSLTVGELFYLTAQEALFAPGLYAWNGTTWIVQVVPTKTSPIQIVADQITAGQLTVGGPGSRPTVLTAEDNSSAVIGEIGKMSGTGPWGDQYGGWFKNLGIGGSVSSAPSLWIDSGGNMVGSSGQVIDFQGNIVFKNKVSVPGNGTTPSVTTSWADLGTTSDDINIANPDMLVTTKGNPLLVGASALLHAFTGSGGAITAVSGVCSAGSPGHFNSTGSSAASFAFDFSGSGSGAAISVSVSPVFGSGPYSPPTSFNYVFTLVDGGSGFTVGDTCDVTVSVPPGCTFTAFSTGTFSCTVSAGGGTTPVSGVSVSFRIRMDNVNIAPSLTMSTDAQGYAQFSQSQLVLPCNAGNHQFTVRAMKVGASTVECRTRQFFMLELG